MKRLDLFTGIGGFTQAAGGLPLETVGFSEINEFCCQYLKDNYPTVPNLGDVRNIEKTDADINHLPPNKTGD